MSHCNECRKHRAEGAEAVLERRNLLRVGAAGAALLLIEQGCGPSSGAGGQPPAGDDAGDAGDDADVGDGGADAACTGTCPTGPKVVELSFAKYPGLKNVGGSAGITVKGYSDPVCGGSDIIVVQASAGKYLAFSASCTHACCKVAFSAKAGEFQCPCHGSVFDLNGQVVSGPAPMALPKLSVCADECGVYVTF